MVTDELRRVLRRVNAEGCPPPITSTDGQSSRLASPARSSRILLLAVHGAMAGRDQLGGVVGRELDLRTIRRGAHGTGGRLLGARAMFRDKAAVWDLAIYRDGSSPAGGSGPGGPQSRCSTARRSSTRATRLRLTGSRRAARPRRPRQLDALLPEDALLSRADRRRDSVAGDVAEAIAGAARWSRRSVPSRRTERRRQLHLAGRGGPAGLQRDRGISGSHVRG